MLPFPDINPIALQLGPLAIRWYSLAYVAGILLGWQLLKYHHKRKAILNLTPKAMDDMVLWATLGIVLGGRLGYVLFYKPAYYLEYPAQVLHLWEGGMSFHGGMLGFILAFILFCRRYGIPFFPLMDLLASVAPIGLFLGRIANFINGELYGRISDVPWAMVFPHSDGLPRHPSQLYQAGMEGILLFALLFWLARFTSARGKPGFLSGAFLTGYALARMTGELFREPDRHLGFIIGHATMGQLLSLPMLLLGLYLMLRRVRPCP